MGRLGEFLGKKIKASSLVETLVASVIIMIVFGIAMATISNTLERSVKSSTSLIDKELNKLVYLYQNEKIQAPDLIDFDMWSIDLKKESEDGLNYVVFQANHKNNSKQRTRRILE